MKIRISELPVGSCFMKGRKVSKKTGDQEVVCLGKGGKERKRTIKRDDEVESTPCPLRMIGVGLRGNPEAVLELGNGRPRRIV